MAAGFLLPPVTSPPRFEYKNNKVGVERKREKRLWCFALFWLIICGKTFQKKWCSSCPSPGRRRVLCWRLDTLRQVKPARTLLLASFFLFRLHEAKALLFSTARPRYSSVHTDTPLHLTLFFQTLFWCARCSTVAVSREMPSLVGLCDGCITVSVCSRDFLPHAFVLCVFVWFFCFCFFFRFPAGPSAPSHTVFPLAGSSL